MNYSFTWTQPYHGWPTQSKTPEMAVIEAIDHLVDSGLILPEIDAILNAVINNSKE